VTSVALGGLSIVLSIGKHLNQIELVPRTIGQAVCSACRIGRSSRLDADRARVSFSLALDMQVAGTGRFAEFLNIATRSGCTLAIAA
jgi:hypothetical protein